MIILAFGLNDFLLLFLPGPVDDKGCPLGLLLGDLLGLDGCGVLAAEGQLRDGDIVKNDVEILGSVGQQLADHHGHLLTLGDELGGVELGHHRLEDLVADRWQHFLVKVHAQFAVHSGNVQHVRTRQDSQTDVHL